MPTTNLNSLEQERPFRLLSRCWLYWVSLTSDVSPLALLLILPCNSFSSSQLFNPHQRCGYSDSPFARRDTFLYCRVQKWVGGGWHPGHGDTKRKLHLRKKHFFVIEKYVEDVKQDEKLAFFKWVFKPLTSTSHRWQPLSGPCSIEKYPSARMANRYTCIFDAGG